MEEMQPTVAPENTMPVPEPDPMPVPETNKLLGPIIGIGVVLLALVLGGFYLWGSMLTKETAEDTFVPPQHTAPQASTVPNTTGVAPDDINALENELNTTPVDSADGSAEIDAALGGA